jgi:hypothetical protein
MSDSGTAERQMSFGEKAVGLTFNPSNDPDVEAIKRQFAKIIDVLATLREGTGSGEKKRMYSLAITESQTAQMWGVKAATWRE